MNRRGKLCLISLTWTITIIAAYIFVDARPTFFQLSFTASTAAAAQDGVLSINPRSNVPALQSWYVTLHHVTGISYKALNQFPLGVIGRMALAAAIVWRVVGDMLPASLMALAVGTNSWASWGFNSIFVHSLGGILILTVALIVAIRYSSSGYQKRSSILLLVVAAGTWGLDYTAFAWIGAALGVIIGIDFLKSNKFMEIKSRGSVVALAVLAGILGLMKNTIVSAINLSISLSSSTPGYNSYSYVRDEQFFTFSKIYYYTIALALVVYGSSKLYQTLANRKITLSNREQLLGVISFASGAIIVVYLLIGRFQQFFIFLLGPIIGLIAVDSLGSELRRIQFPTSIQNHGTVIFLVILIVSATGGFIAAPSEISPASEANAESAGYWITEYRDDTTVLTDLTTQARLRVGAYKAGNIDDVSPIDYTLESYSAVVEGGKVESEMIVVDYSAKNGVGVPGWKRFENLSTHENKVELNKNMDAVYSNGYVSTYTSNQS